MQTSLFHLFTPQYNTWSFSCRSMFLGFIQFWLSLGLVVILLVQVFFSFRCLHLFVCLFVCLPCYSSFLSQTLLPQSPVKPVVNLIRPNSIRHKLCSYEMVLCNWIKAERHKNLLWTNQETGCSDGGTDEPTSKPGLSLD